MDYIILIMFLIVLCIQIYILKKTTAKTVVHKYVEKPQKLTKEQKEKQEKLKKSFDNLMNYDYEEALKKKE